MSLETVVVSNARGESFAAVARRTGSVNGITVAPDATDEEVIDAFAASVALLTGTQVYATTAAGIAAVGEGASFWTADANGLRLWRDIGGVATEIETLFNIDDVLVDEVTLDVLIERADLTSNNLVIGGGGGSLTNSAAGAHVGDSNVGIGPGVFDAMTTGYASTAVGSDAGAFLTTGHSNTLLGYQSGHNLTTGIMNILVGVDAGYLSTAMNYSVVIGHHALNAGAFAGDAAIIIGQQAARSLTTGSNIIIMGRNALANSPGTGTANCIVIGANTALKSSVATSVLLGTDIMQSSAGVGARTITDCVIAGWRSMFGQQTAAYCTIVGTLGFFQSDADTTAAEANAGLGHSVGYLISGNYNTLVGTYVSRRLTKQNINYLCLFGYRVGDQSGSDWTPVNHDIAIGYGPTAAERVLYGNMSTGILNTKSHFNAGGVLKSATYTVATLPAAATVGAGARAYVTDANSTTYRAAAAGGGANKVSVFTDGASWFLG
jgi:hypothetical protein